MLYCQYWKRSQDCVVVIAVRYRLNGLGIESQLEARFFMATRPTPKPNQPPVQWLSSLLQGLNRQQAGAKQQPPPSTRLQMGHCYTSTSPSVLAHRCHGVTFTHHWRPNEALQDVSPTNLLSDSQIRWPQSNPHFLHYDSRCNRITGITQDNILNLWLPHAILSFCSDEVFRFSKSTTSDIKN